MTQFIEAAHANRLLQAVIRAAEVGLDLAERRRRVLVALTDITEADAGHWAWGRGNPVTSTIAPVAILHVGFSAEQLAGLYQSSLDPEMIELFQKRAMSRFDDRQQFTLTRRDIHSDDEWQRNSTLRRYVEQLGLEEWLQSVRYSTDDTWSGLRFMRQTGKPEFSQREAAIVDLAMAGVGWLHAQAEETVAPEAFVDLTPRQRTVMLMQLDGMSRKQIAVNLGITEDTVGDHLKALYQNFKVRSAGELAARFLKNQ